MAIDPVTGASGAFDEILLEKWDAITGSSPMTVGEFSGDGSMTITGHYKV